MRDAKNECKRLHDLASDLSTQTPGTFLTTTQNTVHITITEPKTRSPEPVKIMRTLTYKGRMTGEPPNSAKQMDERVGKRDVFDFLGRKVGHARDYVIVNSKNPSGRLGHADNASSREAGSHKTISRICQSNGRKFCIRR